MTWGAATRLPSGAGERGFGLDVDGRAVPGVVWLPAGVECPRPAVLLGHGGSSHKRSTRNRRLADLITGAGLVALAIDGPFHGDRVGGRPLPADVYRRMVADEGALAVTGRMVADWLAVVAALERTRLTAAGPVGYIGMSMGARYGLPVAAALGLRLGALVVGKFGLAMASTVDPRLHPVGPIERAAREVTAPALVHVQWDDELFPRDGQLALFDLLASPDRRLVASPGPHRSTPPGAEREWVDFVTARLAGDDEGSGRDG